ncbi:hypothetical protein G6F43_006161 [Rhizopus delemar]|nr:hypothetical protein G6F43_006161 [Rhizopus delemar]
MTSQINLFNDRLRQQLETLELEYQRWNNCKQDYDALEALLTTLPETTTKTAMIPMGKLAFMPGKLIHTNEILVLLGDQYYVERSAKQAIEILGRRKEHVNTNLNLVEAEINSVKAKSKALVDTGILSEAQFNEEGLPIMEIREEWPEEEGKVLQKVQTKVEEKTPSSTLPPSVQRARDMMNSQPAKDSGDENKALFDMLKELEEEEEEEEEEEKPRGQGKPWLRGLNEESDKEAESDNEDDERYDMELSENIFDKFDEENDEEFPLDGIVDQDDFTYHDQETQEEVYEKSTPSVLTKPKHKKIEPEIELEAKEPKEELKPAVQQKVAESVPPTDESIQQEKTPKKKMSKFKLMKQQERRKDAPVTKEEKRKPVKEEPVKEEPVKKEVKEEPVKKEVKEEIKEEPLKEEVKKAKDEKESTQEKELPKKKVSKFKLMKQQERKQDTQKPSVESSIKEVKEEQPSDEEKEVRKAVRKVTWDAHATVIEHENHDAPSVLSKVSSYSEPVKNEGSMPTKIRSASSILQVIRQTQEDDYPSLDDDDYGTQTVDLNELIRLARENQEPFYRPADGSMIPIPKQMEEEQQQQQGGIIIAKKSKLDNKIMKGSVMERESVSVDVDKLEEDMDLKEITSRYHAKRQQILAATGSLSFESKPEIEVFDEELPLPSKQLQEEEEEEEEIPKKVSRFKAARLRMKENQ